MSDWLVADALAPNSTGPLAQLFAASALGELAVPHCAACGLALELDQARCDECGATDVAWRRADPSGTVHSVTTVHRREPGLIVADTAYHIVDVELSSGHRLLMTTEQPTTVPPRIGDHATIVFRHVGDVAVPALHTTTPAEDYR